jgi:outer membrane lipoprotein SlyB
VEVEIVLADGTELTGHIVALRDSSIVVSADVTKGTNGIIVLPHRQVLNVQTAGSSHVLVGLFSGCTLGCLTGLAIGRSQSVHSDCGPGGEAMERDANGVIGGAIGSLVGSLVGLAVGAGVSHSSRALISPAQRDFKVLKGVARYPDSEPEYLKTVAS